MNAKFKVAICILLACVSTSVFAQGLGMNRIILNSAAFALGYCSNPITWLYGIASVFIGNKAVQFFNIRYKNCLIGFCIGFGIAFPIAISDSHNNPADIPFIIKVGFESLINGLIGLIVIMLITRIDNFFSELACQTAPIANKLFSNKYIYISTAILTMFVLRIVNYI